MTKKDYIEFAKMLHNKYPIKSDLETFGEYEARLETFKAITTGLTSILAEDNANFCIDKFYKVIHSQ